MQHPWFDYNKKKVYKDIFTEDEKRKIVEGFVYVDETDQGFKSAEAAQDDEVLDKHDFTKISLTST